MEQTNLVITPVGRTYGSTTDDDSIVVHKNNRITIGPRVQVSLGIMENDNILFGELGGKWFVTSQEVEGVSNFRLRKTTKKSRILEFNSKSLSNLPQGRYHLGARIQDANRINWFPLVKND